MVVPSQQFWFGQANELVLCHPSVRVSQRNRLYIVQACNQCSLKIDTTKKSLNSHRALSLMGGWGLDTRLTVYRYAIYGHTLDDLMTQMYYFIATVHMEL